MLQKKVWYGSENNLAKVVGRILAELGVTITAAEGDKGYNADGVDISGLFGLDDFSYITGNSTVNSVVLWFDDVNKFAYVVCPTRNEWKIGNDTSFNNRFDFLIAKIKGESFIFRPWTKDSSDKYNKVVSNDLYLFGKNLDGNNQVNDFSTIASTNGWEFWQVPEKLKLVPMTMGQAVIDNLYTSINYYCPLGQKVTSESGHEFICLDYNIFYKIS